MPPFLGRQCCTSSMITLPSQVPRPHSLSVYMLVWLLGLGFGCSLGFLVFLTLKECILDLFVFFVLTQHKTLLKYQASLEQFLRVL